MSIRYLTGASNKSVADVSHANGIGLLITPDTAGLRRDGKVGKYRNHIGRYPTWAADNGAFSAKQSFSTDRWWAWLGALSADLTPAEREACLFATAPDVLTWHPLEKNGRPVLDQRGRPRQFCIGHAAPTLTLFRQWAPRIRALGFRTALVAQDGLETMLDEVPWDLVDVVFIGGSDGFKLGPAAAAVCRRAILEGKRIHMGRVNSGKRLALAQGFGCHTADGTFLAHGPDQNLPKVLGWLESLRLAA